MQRVLIVGPCGAGKSTLAAELGPLLGLPVVHMDQLNWRPGWTESTKPEIAARLEAVLAEDRWLIDGTYGGTLAPRLARADMVVWLDYPIRLCLWRLLRRYARWHGRARPDMTEGCPEQLDLAFLWYVLRWNHGPAQRLALRLRNYHGPIIRLRHPRETAQWLASGKLTNGAVTNRR